ncbi:MAG: DUF4435 domain-containing protein [Prevotellaceae bacterium]|nr:DUF4435 domain-containing protein [Prevotellaceae bacterium]
MPLEFSTDVRQAATVFKNYRNSIDIYTEDCHKDKEFYVKLLKRLLSDTNIEINDIHPLGCRKTVIKCCQNDIEINRKKLYIVDGDIFLQYEKKGNIKNLYILDAYCIENYMICEDAICDVAYKFHARDSYDNVKKTLNIPQTLNEIAESLIKLFFYYSIQMECYGNFDLRHIDFYMSGKQIDIDKIEKRIEEIRNGLIQNGVSKERIGKLLSNREKQFPYNENTLLKIVSGKDFIIPYFIHYIEKNFNCSFRLPKETWKFNLVDKCDIRRLEPLKHAILSV